MRGEPDAIARPARAGGGTRAWLRPARFTATAPGSMTTLARVLRLPGASSWGDAVSRSFWHGKPDTPAGCRGSADRHCHRRADVLGRIRLVDCMTYTVAVRSARLFRLRQAEPPVEPIPILEPAQWQQGERDESHAEGRVWNSIAAHFNRGRGRVPQPSALRNPCQSAREFRAKAGGNPCQSARRAIRVEAWG